MRGNAKTRGIKEDIIMKKRSARALAGVLTLTLSMAAALTACGGSDSAKREKKQQQKVQALLQDRLFP